MTGAWAMLRRARDPLESLRGRRWQSILMVRLVDTE